MIEFSFDGHRACFRELMEELAEGLVAHEVEFRIHFEDDPFGDGASHSTNCTVTQMMDEADRDALLSRPEAKSPKKNGSTP